MLLVLWNATKQQRSIRLLHWAKIIWRTIISSPTLTNQSAPLIKQYYRNGINKRTKHGTANPFQTRRVQIPISARPEVNCSARLCNCAIVFTQQCLSRDRLERVSNLSIFSTLCSPCKMSPCVGGYVLSAARAVKDVRVADRALAMWELAVHFWKPYWTGSSFQANYFVTIICR